jgi:radical SAM protein with 4Fe4S-binding SPASM domain
VSLEGASPATHDRVRGEGSFERTLAGIERLARAGLGGRVSIAFTEMLHNMEDVPGLQYRDLLSRYHSDPRFRGLCDRYGRLSAVEWWRGRCGERGEPCPFIEHPYLSPEGKGYPCLLLQEDACTVAGALDAPLGVSLAEGIPIWSRLREQARARSAQIPECRECPGEARCAGGCMARAQAASGQLAGVEDRCELRRTVCGWCE